MLTTTYSKNRASVEASISPSLLNFHKEYMERRNATKQNCQREQVCLQFSLRFTNSEASGWNAMNAKLLQSCATLGEPMDYGLSRGFSRQEYWSGLPCPPPGDLPNPWVEPMSPMFPALAGGLFTTSATWEASEGWGPRYI